MTKEQDQQQIQALLNERRSYQDSEGNTLEGKEENLAAVDAELQRLGHEAKPPHKRAERRRKKSTAKSTAKNTAKSTDKSTEK